MQTYLCAYTRDGETFRFACQADDADHAIEQLIDAEPLAQDVAIERID